MRRINLALTAVLSGLMLSFPCASVEAQGYPARPIRFIVPFAAGGGNDIVGRIIAEKLSEALGQPVVVDNRAGAGGIIGTNIAAKAPADGHTMLVNSISLVFNAILRKKLPYDTLNDLAPVTMMAGAPFIVLVHPSVPAKSVGELLTLARSKPGQINYASGGVGSQSHLATELLKLMTKVELAHVPYKGVGPAVSSVVGGEVQLVISPVVSALPQIKAGRLRPLAVTTIERSSLFSEVPTTDEAGVPGYEYNGWYGLLVPAGTSEPVIKRLNTEMDKILNFAAIKEQFGLLGLEPIHTSPEAFGKRLRADFEKWGKVIKASGVKAE